MFIKTKKKKLEVARCLCLRKKFCAWVLKLTVGLGLVCGTVIPDTEGLRENPSSKPAWAVISQTAW